MHLPHIKTYAAVLVNGLIGNYDGCNNICEQSRAAENREADCDKSDDGGINVEIFGNTAAYAANSSVG